MSLSLKKYQNKPALIHGREDKLFVSGGARINDALLNTRSGTITIESGVMFGHRVMVLTGKHDRDGSVCGGRDILIRAGAYVGSGAILIGPVVIGRNAVVGAGSVVTKDVADNTFVCGVPAKVR